MSLLAMISQKQKTGNDQSKGEKRKRYQWPSEEVRLDRSHRRSVSDNEYDQERLFCG